MSKKQVKNRFFGDKSVVRCYGNIKFELILNKCGKFHVERFKHREVILKKPEKFRHLGFFRKGFNPRVWSIF